MERTTTRGTASFKKRAHKINEGAWYAVYKRQYNKNICNKNTIISFSEYGRGYNMRQKDESGLHYMPEGMEDREYFWICSIHLFTYSILCDNSVYIC